jgi:hypothetical protein
MSKSAIGALLWAEMSEAQKIEAVSTGHATLKEMVEGLLDGSSELRAVCRKVLANSDVCLEQQIQNADETRCAHSEPSELAIHNDEEGSEEEVAAATQSAAIESARKRRQGLPVGYVPRLHKL